MSTNNPRLANDEARSEVAVLLRGFLAELPHDDVDARLYHTNLEATATAARSRAMDSMFSGRPRLLGVCTDGLLWTVWPVSLGLVPPHGAAGPFDLDPGVERRFPPGGDPVRVEAVVDSYGVLVWFRSQEVMRYLLPYASREVR